MILQNVRNCPPSEIPQDPSVQKLKCIMHIHMMHLLYHDTECYQRTTPSIRRPTSLTYLLTSVARHWNQRPWFLWQESWVLLEKIDQADRSFSLEIPCNWGQSVTRNGPWSLVWVSHIAIVNRIACILCVACIGQFRIGYKILVRKCEGEGPLGRLRHRFEYGIKVDFRRWMGGFVLFFLVCVWVGHLSLLVNTVICSQ